MAPTQVLLEPNKARVSSEDLSLPKIHNPSGLLQPSVALLHLHNPPAKIHFYLRPNLHLLPLQHKVRHSSEDKRSKTKGVPDSVFQAANNPRTTKVEEAEEVDEAGGEVVEAAISNKTPKARTPSVLSPKEVLSLSLKETLATQTTKVELLPQIHLHLKLVNSLRVRLFLVEVRSQLSKPTRISQIVLEDKQIRANQHLARRLPQLLEASQPKVDFHLLSVNRTNRNLMLASGLASLLLVLLLTLRTTKTLIKLKIHSKTGRKAFHNSKDKDFSSNSDPRIEAPPSLRFREQNKLLPRHMRTSSTGVS